MPDRAARARGVMTPEELAEIEHQLYAADPGVSAADVARLIAEVKRCWDERSSVLRADHALCECGHDRASHAVVDFGGSTRGVECERCACTVWVPDA